MEKGGGKKWLVIALVFLGVVIVGLVIGIVAVNLNNEVEDSDDEVSHEELVEGDYDASYNISNNISKIYNTDSKEEALELYSREIGLAIDSGNYDLFQKLMASRATLLTLDDRCEDAALTYDDMDPSILPEEYRLSFYYTAAMQNNVCENNERENYYLDLYNQLIGEQEIEVEVYE